MRCTTVVHVRPRLREALNLFTKSQRFVDARYLKSADCFDELLASKIKKLSTFDMSNLHAATKVADQLISRLFDHRQFTSGEINYLVKQHGQSVDLEENFRRILKINQDVCVISDANENVPCKSGDQMSKEILDQVNLLNERAEYLLRLEDEFKAKEASSLGEMRLEHQNMRQDCDRNISARLERLNESLVSEELELERKYLKFEENLRKC